MSHLPVILKIMLTDLVTLVVTVLRGILREALDVSGRNVVGIGVGLDQEVSKGVSRAMREIAISQKPLRVARSCANRVVGLIALRGGLLRSELPFLSTESFG